MLKIYLVYCAVAVVLSLVIGTLIGDLLTVQEELHLPGVLVRPVTT